MITLIFQIQMLQEKNDVKKNIRFFDTPAAITGDLNSIKVLSFQNFGRAFIKICSLLPIFSTFGYYF